MGSKGEQVRVSATNMSALFWYSPVRIGSGLEMFGPKMEACIGSARIEDGG